jgi:hypothetical protein
VYSLPSKPTGSVYRLNWENGREGERNRLECFSDRIHNSRFPGSVGFNLNFSQSPMSTSDLRASKAQTAQPSNPRSPSPSDPHDTPQSDASLLPLPPAAPFSSSRRPPHPTRPHFPPPATALPSPLALQNCAPGRPQILSQIVPGQIDRRSPALPRDCRRRRPPSDLP